MFLNLPDPAVHPLKAPLVSDVVHEEDALGSPAVAAYDGAEPSLTTGVPDLQLDSLAINKDGGRLVGGPS